MGDNYSEFFPQIRLEDYDYSLPKNRIAGFPLENRAESRLLVVRSDDSPIDHRRFYELPQLLPDDALLVLNDSRVIPARVLCSKPSGGRVEIFCMEALKPSADPQITLMSTGHCSWKCLIGGRNIKTGTVLRLEAKNQSEELTLEIVVKDKKEQEATVDFSWNPQEKTFSEILQLFGLTPLPPYIKRDSVELDKTRYQTVFADHDGSVAAPTAGLHFTNEIFDQLRNKNIEIIKITLHVGAGTFQPINDNDVNNHEMHKERFLISSDTINKLLYKLQLKPSAIVATGTTALRTSETLYWLGAKLLNGYIPFENFFELAQYEPYKLAADNNLPDTISAYKAVANYLDDNRIDTLCGETALFIVPGYKFRVIDTLITNFHIPKSTLILLVAAFVGKELWQNAYSEALNNSYRFLSYGDTSLLFRKRL